MTLKEAENTIFSNTDLIGKFYENKEISHLIIVPSQKENLGQILGNVNLDIDYANLLRGYNDFEILALLDFDQYPNTGFADSESFDKVRKAIR